MNFKQKLVYMLIGSLFTLAGYFLATLANNQPTDAHAQDSTTKVFDKIVCKELDVVNKDGYSVVSIGIDVGGEGSIDICNKDGELSMGLTGLGGGIMSLYNREDLSVLLDGESGGLYLYHIDGKRSVSLVGHDSSLLFYNRDEKQVVKLDAIDSGILNLYNKDGKNLVDIGSMKDSPNDGLINIYNFKGDHRSYAAD